MISKELLIEVKKYKYATINTFRVAGKHIEVTFNETNSKDKINIYELAHKCKEWALNLGIKYMITYIDGYVIYESKIGNKSYIIQMSDLNPENDFILFQWILDNKDN